MKSLVVCAMQEEVSDFLAEVKNHKLSANPELYEITYCGKKAYLLITGVDTINAVYALTSVLTTYDKKISKVINVGYAGGVGLLKGEFYTIINCFLLDSDLTHFGRKKYFIPGIDSSTYTLTNFYGNYQQTKLYSSNSFQDNPLKELPPYACDMEGVGIAFVCEKFQKPLQITKYISDLIGTSNQLLDYSQNENSSGSVLSHFIKNFLLEDK